MSQPTACPRARSDSCYCSNCDLLVGLDGFHVVDVSEQTGWRGARLQVVVESAPGVEACRRCGVVASSHGRRDVRLVDMPSFGRPVELVWRKRTWRCADPDCAAGVCTEQDEVMARPRALLTTRACWWAINQVRREHASVQGLARQLGTSWRTVWRSIQPLLEQMAADHKQTRLPLRSANSPAHRWALTPVNLRTHQGHTRVGHKAEGGLSCGRP